MRDILCLPCTVLGHPISPYWKFLCKGRRMFLYDRLKNSTRSSYGNGLIEWGEGISGKLLIFSGSGLFSDKKSITILLRSRFSANLQVKSCQSDLIKSHYLDRATQSTSIFTGTPNLLSPRFHSGMF